MVDKPATTQVVRSGYLVAGRYRLLSRLGSGGMGAVWLARDQLLSREVAVKQVLSTAGMTPAEAADQRVRALHEGRTAARLSHPHSVTMYDVAVDRGEPWLVMEHLPSRSLAAVVTQRGPLPALLVAQIGAQVADALAAAHAAGVVHRDVKPGNVLLAEGGRAAGTVKITDFGISRTHGDVTVTAIGIITGTPAFFAPEVARGEDSTPASDVFALGATLYAAVEGSPPFGMDENVVALLHRVAAGEVERPQRAGPLRASLLHMLEPDPRNRPTMAQARDELARVAATGNARDAHSILAATTSVSPLAAGGGATSAERTAVGEPATRTVRTTTTHWPLGPLSHHRRRAVLSAAAAVLLLLTVLAVFLGTRTARTTGASPLVRLSPTASVDPTPSNAAPASALAPTATAPAAEPSVTTANAQQVRDSVARYYLPLPADPQVAWDLLSPEYQDQLKRGEYNQYWQQLSAITLTTVRVTGPDAALVTLELTPVNGDQYSVLRELTFAPDPAASMLLVSSTDQMCIGGAADICPNQEHGYGQESNGG